MNCFLVPDLAILLQTQVFADFTEYLPSLNRTLCGLLPCDSLGDNIVMTQFPYRMFMMDSRPKMDLRKN